MNEDAGDIKSAYDLFMQSAMVEKNLAELKSVCSETSEHISELINNTNNEHEQINYLLKSITNNSQDLARSISLIEWGMAMVRFSHCQDYIDACFNLSGNDLAEKLADSLCNLSKAETQNTINQFIEDLKSDIISSTDTYDLKFDDVRVLLICSPQNFRKEGFDITWVYHNHKSQADSVRIYRSFNKCILHVEHKKVISFDDCLLKKFTIEYNEFCKALLMKDAMKGVL